MTCFNPSRGIAIIQTGQTGRTCRCSWWFQSLTRDSNHSNLTSSPLTGWSFMFQSLTRDSNHSNEMLSSTWQNQDLFQSLTRDSNHSNRRNFPSGAARRASFNPSRGIAIIQTAGPVPIRGRGRRFNPSRGIAIIQTRRARANAV